MENATYTLQNVSGDTVTLVTVARGRLAHLTITKQPIEATVAGGTMS